jgi:uncharacterized protein (TIGR02270 family)
VNLVIPEIISLHVEEAGSLFERRGALLDAAQVRLKDIQRTFDDRIAAHLDALAVAGEHAWQFCQASLDEPSRGAVCTAAVRALEDNRPDRLDKLFALVGAIPETRLGLVWALGWVARDRLQGLGARLIDSQDPLKRAIGIAACSMHRVDPGLASGAWLADADTAVRARALRLVGEVGCDAAVPACARALNDADPECKFWAAWSSLAIGNRGAALDTLANAAVTAGPHRRAAFRLTLQAMSPSDAHRVLKQVAQAPEDKRSLIEGSGVSGDPVYLPWLMTQMRKTTTARLAGEAFSLITGVDLVDDRLDAKTPAGVETGPTGDFDGRDVDMDEDEALDSDPDDGLPQPDVEKVEAWWAANASRFQVGTRYFMGAPVTRENCIDVLKNGYQRQRILAAHYLCLLDPGTPLFNTSAPAWRQQRLLAKMT